MDKEIRAVEFKLVDVNYNKPPQEKPLPKLQGRLLAEDETKPKAKPTKQTKQPKQTQKAWRKQVIFENAEPEPQPEPEPEPKKQVLEHESTVTAKPKRSSKYSMEEIHYGVDRIIGRTPQPTYRPRYQRREYRTYHVDKHTKDTHRIEITIDINHDEYGNVKPKIDALIKPQKDSLGYKHGEYTLYSKQVATRGNGTRTHRFFAKNEVKDAQPCEKPKGYDVKINKRSGLPYLKKKQQKR